MQIATDSSGFVGGHWVHEWDKRQIAEHTDNIILHKFIKVR